MEGIPSADLLQFAKEPWVKMGTKIYKQINPSHPCNCTCWRRDQEPGPFRQPCMGYPATAYWAKWCNWAPVPPTANAPEQCASGIVKYWIDADARDERRGTRRAWRWAIISIHQYVVQYGYPWWVSAATWFPPGGLTPVHKFNFSQKWMASPNTNSESPLWISATGNN